jgi:hypothetical protein
MIGLDLVVVEVLMKETAGLPQLWTVVEEAKVPVSHVNPGVDQGEVQ